MIILTVNVRVSLHTSWLIFQDPEVIDNLKYLIIINMEIPNARRNQQGEALEIETCQLTKQQT